MAAPSTARPRPLVIACVAAVVLLFVVAGAATQGLAGALAMLGLAAVVLGVGAAIAGRARWAFISSRRIGGVVAAAGMAALLVGGATATPTTPTASSGAVETEKPAPAVAPDPSAAAEAAEAALAQAETAENAIAADALVASTPGLLSDGATEAAVDAKGRAPRTGYDRAAFGAPWADTDHNGCDTRNDILARDLGGETFKPGTHDCVVLTGTLADPYSARTIPFQRGQGTSHDVQIDHVVALSDAWQKGAQGLDAARRTAFANDPLNLLAVDGPLNMQKGDGDAASWLPPDRSYRCAYVARQVAVKATYDLWMTQAEKNAIATILSSCPNEPLPAGVVVDVPERQPTPPPPPPPSAEPRPAPAPVPAPVPAPAPAPAPPPPPAPVPAPGVYYQNCDAVRAA